MDHRASYGTSLFGVHGAPTAEQHARMVEAKAATYDGLLDVVTTGLPGNARPGVLVDGDLGLGLQRRATGDGVTLAIPLEASGHELITLANPGHWQQEVIDLAPSYVKVLVRWNPEDSEEDRREQTDVLAPVSAWLREQGVAFLFELLVPASDAQLASVGGDADRYDAELRPDLVVRTIGELQAEGVEPAVWKIEGLETSAAAEAVVAAARAGGRDEVDCVVLGRDAPQERLDHWLRVAAPVDGFVGFAIGRSIWEDAVRRLEAATLDRAGVVAEVAETYLHFAKVYVEAAAS